MAKTLADALRGAAASVAAPQTGQAQRTAELLKAKTGKAVAGRGPGMSSLAEQAGVTAAQQALTRGRETAELGAQQVEAKAAGIEQQGDIQQQQLDMSRAKFTAHMEQKSKELLSTIDRAMRDIDTQRGKMQLEQLGFTMAMQDKKYLHNIQQYGQKMRLDNEINFTESMKESIFADMASLMSDDYSFREMLDMDKRQFEEELANMDLSAAGAIADATADANQQAAMYSAWGNASVAGAKTYANWDTAAKEAPVKEAAAIKARGELAPKKDPAPGDGKYTPPKTNPDVG